PILNYFFLANEILSGNSTKLLDKIVGYWLRKEWFENCECRSNPPLDPNDPNYIDDPDYRNTPDPAIEADELCPDGSKRCRNITISPNPDGSLSKTSCKGFYYAQITWYERTIPNSNFLNKRNTQGGYVTLDVLPIPENASQGFLPYINTNNYLVTFVEDARRTEESPQFQVVGSFTGQAYFSTDGINFSPLTDNRTPFTNYSKCPETDPDGGGEGQYPPDLCAILPELEECNLPPDDPNSECEVAYVIVEENIRCTGLRKPIRLALNISGTVENIEIQEFSECGNPRNTQTLSLFSCSPDEEPPPLTCEEREQLVRDYAVYIAENEQVYEGFYRPANINDLGFGLGFLRNNTEIYDAQCDQDFTEWFTEAWYEHFTVFGCTDPEATNYNPDATENDGSC
ncbi:hypothetical protein, partial [Pseudanabaena sp. BC1403]|uniref:hypothetical protein n=1 Tax=Pseudanabaena sp. BC1403 TaxID=2043171 RepID=UPI0015E1800A